MRDEQVGWAQATTGAWTRALHGLLLRVTPVPDDAEEPWMWEVLQTPDDVTEYEIGLGGAEAEDAAMAWAEGAARAYRRQAEH